MRSENILDGVMEWGIIACRTLHRDPEYVHWQKGSGILEMARERVREAENDGA